MEHINHIKANLQTISNNIEKLQDSSLICAQSITILAASKAQSTTAIEQAIEAGISHFGENKVQEAASKWPEIKQRHPHITLHLIGTLQTNKVKTALALFDVIQSIDRPELAEAIASLIPPPAIATKQFYIQVNTGEEIQKSGILPQKADEFINYSQKLKLPVVGLMCVPPHDQPPAPHFALLREIALRNGLSELSMGMSSDYETAARMGSTMIRIGTTLFGKRQ